jgi:hypothetical protein
MLFISEAILESRKRLIDDLDLGRITEEQTCQRALELDPDDYIALVWLGQIRKDRGDKDGAEECFWKAIEANPWFWSGYLSLVQVIPADTPLGNGLFALGCGKLCLDELAIDSEEVLPLLKQIQSFGDSGDLSKREQVEVFAEVLAERREGEPPDVTARLRPYELIHELHSGEDLPAELVDDLIEAGPFIEPLLVGTLRGWARGVTPDDTDHVAENALALLGESGDPSLIPNILEFVTVEDSDICAVAGWALDRLLDRHPREAAPIIAGLIPTLAAAERISLATRLLLHPAVDADGHLMASLGENLGPVSEEDFDPLFPLLVSSMILARGRAGVGMAREFLDRHKNLLPGKIRRKCERHITSMERNADSRMAPLAKPSAWTVYDICAGEAIWDDEGEDYVPTEEELLEVIDNEDGLYVPEPIHILPKPVVPTPGRNDLCWCGSGKKYKKCHLESDQQGGGPQPQRVNGKAVAATPHPLGNVDYGGRNVAPPSRFDPLRQRIGRFLMEAVPEEESALALQEFLGEDAGKPDSDDKMAPLDWMVHDWIPPTLGRRVIPQFLRRRGSSLTKQEREIAESWSRSVITLYEVREVQAGSGCTLKNLFTNETFFAHDISLSNSLVRWDGLLARVVDGDRGHEVTGTGFSVPRPQLDAMRQWMEDDHRASGLAWPEYLKRHWPRIRRKPAELYAQRLEAVQLVNTDGESVLLSKSVYQVMDGEVLATALRDCSVISNDGDGVHYSWLKTMAQDDTTILGTIRIQGAELVLECNSKERCERGKKLLAGIAGAALRHVRDEHITQKEIKRLAKEDSPANREAEFAWMAPGAGESSIPPEVSHDVVRKALEKHYAEWPGIALPALNGQTPRQAVETVEGRRKVIDLLRQFENGEERKRKNGQPFYDVNKLRKALALED